MVAQTVLARVVDPLFHPDFLLLARLDPSFGLRLRCAGVSLTARVFLTAAREATVVVSQADNRLAVSTAQVRLGLGKTVVTALVKELLDVGGRGGTSKG